MIETTVVIPHSGSTETLIAVLVQLQMQTTLPKHIYIIDCSKEKSGLRIAKKFAFNNIPITVEVVNGTIYENWNRGIIFSQNDYPHASVLIINDDILLPTDAIERFQEAESYTSDLCYVPETPPRTHAEESVTVPFNIHSSIQAIENTKWMCGFVFYLTERCINEVGRFDEGFKIWFGDTDYQRRILRKGTIKIIRGLYVYHFGSRSYGYKSQEVQDQIAVDRALFHNE